MPPRLAAFPKAFMDALCVTRSMSVIDWIRLAAELDIDGLEFYSGFLPEDERSLQEIRTCLHEHDLAMPMLCCSPDFTVPDPDRLEEEINREKRMIRLTAFFGGKFCRVLSGQRRPGLSRAAGLAQVVWAIERLLPVAEEEGVVLSLENHYKDNYWTHPEFAQKMDVFLELVARIDSPWFGVNYDPSNALLAGDDPLLLLQQVKRRVVTMHASDRYLASGTLADLQAETAAAGYSDRLAHGVIGHGLNDYDRIFQTLAEVGFQGWISIEDGLNGMADLRQSVSFLRHKIHQHFNC